MIFINKSDEPATRFGYTIVGSTDSLTPIIIPLILVKTSSFKCLNHFHKIFLV